MKLISTVFITILLSISVAEAKKKVTKNNKRKPASAVLPYCGVVAIKTEGTAHMRTVTVVDQPSSGNGRYFNVELAPDSPEMEISMAYQPRPGDSNPNSDTYVNHNVRIAGENVWMNYAGYFAGDREVTQGKCICITGEKDSSSSQIKYFEGYALRDNSKCTGISQEAVARFSDPR